MFYVGRSFNSWAVKEERSVALIFPPSEKPQPHCNLIAGAAAEWHMSMIFIKVSLNNFDTDILWIETKPSVVSKFYLKDHCKIVLG